MALWVQGGRVEEESRPSSLNIEKRGTYIDGRRLRRKG